MPVEFDSPAATGRVVFDETPASGVVFDSDPYSPEAIAKQRQDVVQSTARLRAMREEQAAEAARPKLNIGIRKPFSDELLYQTEIPGPLVALSSEAIKSSPSVAAGAIAASQAMPLANEVGAIPGPVGAIGRVAIPLVAGGLAAIGTRTAQEKFLPEILPESAQRVYDTSAEIAAQNPNSALVGQMLGAAPFFRPGVPIGTTGASRFTVPLVAGGIGAGIEGAQQLASGEFDPQRLALSAAGQALFNRETALGAKIAPNLVLPNIAPERAPSAITEVSARMAGKAPEQQLEILNQETALRKDTLMPTEERVALEAKQTLENQIDAQKAADDAAKAQAKAAQDQQRAAQEAQQAAAEAAQPPKSAQILAEPTAKPPALANVATEIGTQTSPFALQGKLNELTAPPPAADVSPVAAFNTKLDQIPGGPKLAEPAELNSTGVLPTADIPARLTELSARKAKLAQIKSAVANAADYQYTVFRPGEGIPDAIQVDAIGPKGEALGSSNVADLNRAGAKLPEVPEWVPQGRYTLEEIKGLIKQGEPTNAITTRNQPENNQLEHPGTALGENLRPHGGEVRQIEGEQAGGGNRAVGGSPLPAGDQVRQQPLQEPLGRPPEATRKASIRRQQRGAISTKAAITLSGAPAGAAVGYLSTDQQPGESDEAYRARLLRNTLLGAGAGLAAGAGLSAIAQGARTLETAAKQRAPVQRGTELPVVEEGQGIRRTAEKVIENKQYAERVRETLANDPDIIYDKFALGELADRVSGSTEPELKAMLTSPNIRERLGATAELANRYAISKDPALEAEAARLYSDLAQNLTNPAQMLGLGKLVKTPQGYITALNEVLKKVGRTLSGTQAADYRKLAEDSIRSEQRLAATARAAESDFSAANEAAYRQAKSENAQAQKALDDFVHRVAPEGWDTIISKVIQGNLLTPLSLIQNPVGNLVFQPVLRASRALASAMDEIVSATTGKPRTLSELSPIPATAEAKAFAQGVRTASRELLTGPGEESYVKGEIQRGFKPLRSLAQAFTGKDIAVRPDGTISVNDRLKKMFEGTFGAPAEAMFRVLSLGDKPFRRSEEMRVLLAQARLKGLKGRDLIKFIEFPDKHTQALLETEGRHAIFAQENAGVRKLNQFLDSGVAELIGLDKIPAAKGAIKVFFRTQVPYRQFPVNFINTAINFAVPEVAAARAIYHGGLSRAFGKQPDRRAAFIALGEGALGTMMYGAANYLWSHGLISEPADKDAKSRSAQYEQMGPARINISGLTRALQGGDPHWQSGDDTRDWSRLGIPAFVFNVYTVNAAKGRQETARTGENRQRDFGPGQYLKDRLSSFPGVASFALDQSFLSGTSALLDALRDWDEFGDRWTQNTFRAVSSIPVPNTVEALARTQYKYIPELRGDTLTDTLANVWKFKTLQLPQDERATLKRDLWGQPIPRTLENKNPYLDQFIDVSKSQQKVLDPFKQSLVKLYQQTESPDVYPAIPTRQLGVQGITVKLTPEDYDKYQQLVGEARRKYAEIVVANPRFQAADTLPEAKILALQEAYSEGAKTAKEQLLALPGIVDRYFPELVGKPVPPPDQSRVLSRDVKARGRVRAQGP